MKIFNNKFYSYQICEAIPIVSTITSLACIILKKSFNISNKTSFGAYLNSRSLTYLSITLIPIANIISYIFRDKIIKYSPPSLLSSKLETDSRKPSGFISDFFQTTSTKSDQKKIQNPTTSPLINPKTPITSRPRPSGASLLANVFTDDEIIKEHQVTDTIVPYEIENPSIVALKYTTKHVVIQEALEGCSSGVSLMMALDHGKKIKYEDFRLRASAPYNSIAIDLHNAGLRHIEVSLNLVLNISGTTDKLDLKKLQTAILSNGPGAVRIQNPGTNTAHWVIVDDVDLASGMISLRDPWHGWFISVKQDSFLTKWEYAFSQFLQQNTGKGFCEDFMIQIKADSPFIKPLLIDDPISKKVPKEAIIKATDKRPLDFIIERLLANARVSTKDQKQPIIKSTED